MTITALCVMNFKSLDVLYTFKTSQEPREAISICVRSSLCEVYGPSGTKQMRPVRETLMRACSLSDNAEANQVSRKLFGLCSGNNFTSNWVGAINESGISFLLYIHGVCRHEQRCWEQDRRREWFSKGLWAHRAGNWEGEMNLTALKRLSTCTYMDNASWIYVFMKSVNRCIEQRRVLFA